MYFGEAKWSRKLIGVDVLDNLKRKSALVEWNREKRKEHFMLFTRAGFTDALKDRAKKDGVY